MIKATPKADTLPPDLRKHWEDAMADKFPMTRDEAMAYIQNRYEGIQVRYAGKDKIQAEWQQKKPIIEGQQVPLGWSVQYVEAPGYAIATTTLGMSPQDIQRLMNIKQVPSYLYRFEQVIIDDFRKTSIEEKLKDYKS